MTGFVPPRPRIAVGLIAAVLAALPGAAGARDTTASPAPSGGPLYDASGWRVECAPRAGAKTLDCQAVEQVVQRPGGGVLVAMTVRIPPETKKPVMLLQVPLGILLAPGISLGVGDAAAQTYPMQTCTQGGCFAGAPLGDALVQSMRTAALLKIAFQSADGRTLTVSLPLAGFDAAYDKIK